MTEAQRVTLLEVPKGNIDVVLDTDTFNEVDDMYAIAYLLLSKEKLNPKAIYAAPFLNHKSTSPKDGMEKSYTEIEKILALLQTDVPHFYGSETYLTDEKTPVVSPASQDLVKRAKQYSHENPLYVVAIGAITNVASAIRMAPEIAEKIVVVWLGGHAHHFPHTYEFNMFQDVAAARVVMGCGVPFVHLPCAGVVNTFGITKPELTFWLQGKNPLCDYLVDATIEKMDTQAKNKPWTKVLWDVTAVAWLLNDNNRFMLDTLTQTRLPAYDNEAHAPNTLRYTYTPEMHLEKYVYFIHRDTLMEDLLEKLSR